MARDVNRPFIDRRLGMVILFRGNDKDVESVEDALKEFMIQELEVTNLRMSPDKIMSKDNPPQIKIIFKRSSISTSNVDVLESSAKAAIRTTNDRHGTNLKPQTMEITSVALSPGDKVRNAIGV